MEDSGIEDGGEHNGDSLSKPSMGSDSSSNGSRERSPSKLSKTRSLQKKIDTRIDQVKRLHQKYHSSTGLIPIQRLPIPDIKDHKPLVQWDTDDSEEDIVNFFPLSRKESRTQEISDTFSIEEMSISGDEEEDDLHLVPPQTVYKKFVCCPCSICIIL